MAAPGSSLVSLKFSKYPAAKPLIVDRALLWHASTVLQGLIDEICGTRIISSEAGDSNEVSVPLDEHPADWTAVLKLLRHEGSPVSWGNVDSLLRLGDKYDMPGVRNACASFLAAHRSHMSLAAELESPRNPLHAASLEERFLQQAGSSSAAPAARVHLALQAALAPLNLKGGMATVQDMRDWRQRAEPVVKRLTALQAHRRYSDIVAPGVQNKVTALLLVSLNTLMVPFTNDERVHDPWERKLVRWVKGAGRSIRYLAYGDEAPSRRAYR